MNQEKSNFEVRLITCADIFNRVLRINKDSIRNAQDLSSVEARMINEYRHKYPDYRIEYV